MPEQLNEDMIEEMTEDTSQDIYVPETSRAERIEPQDENKALTDIKEIVKLLVQGINTFKEMKGMGGLMKNAESQQQQPSHAQTGVSNSPTIINREPVLSLDVDGALKEFLPLAKQFLNEEMQLKKAIEQIEELPNNPMWDKIKQTIEENVLKYIKKEYK